MRAQQAATVKLDTATIQEIDRLGRKVTDYLDDNPIMWNW
jgi:myo-inositol catabolism protein IolS